MPEEGRFEDTAVPTARDHEELDVRDLPPPEPLQATIERVEAMGDRNVLVQVNDRVPQHLFPILEERGFDYETTGDGPVYTAIWRD